MTTEDVVSSTRNHRTPARKVAYGLLAGVAALTLAGCSSGETFIDGWWDNGDPVLVPTKASLFDDQGVPLCDTPTAFGTLETRARSFSELGGVVNSFLWEVTNPETDPSTASTKKERNKLEVLQDSPGAMYQLTFPTFDKEHGISSPEDMRKVKDELKAHLPDLLTEGPVTSYVKVDDQWIDGPQGHFSVRRADDAEGYIKDNGINTTFNGIQNTYWIAQKDDDGSEWLLVRNKETGAATLMRAGAEDVLLDESTESFTRYFVENESTGSNPDATITLVNDQCRPVGGDNVSRFWVYEYELLDGTEQGPNVIE
ncbi:hypothetical protein [Demequina sp.]|uniref:hypothetical protein n=1 Tax=Demequina sp. TaxID=2050685 RepID=UPI003D11ACCE